MQTRGKRLYCGAVAERHAEEHLQGVQLIWLGAFGGVGAEKKEEKGCPAELKGLQCSVGVSREDPGAAEREM